MEDKIICLVGESGSGKSTIAELLEKDGYNYIQSYTTRKPRYKEEKGHIFIEDGVPCSDFKIRNNKLVPNENVIAYTFYDNEHYWSTREQYKNKGTSIYIIDVAGIKELREKVKDTKILVIYLKADREKRLQRMLKKRDPKSVADRIKHDKEAFRIVPCDYVIDANRSIEEVLEDVKKIIRGGKKR